MPTAKAGIKQDKEVRTHEKTYGPFLGVSFVMLSQAANNFSFVAWEKPGEKVYTRDRAFGPFQKVDSEVYRFSPDGNTLVFSARHDNSMFFHAGDRAMGPYEAVEPQVSVSADNMRFAYCARRGGNAWVFEGKKSYGPYRPLFGVKHLQFSPDGKTLAFTGEWERKISVVIGDRTFGPYVFNAGPIVFSPDGKEYAYAAMVEKKGYFVFSRSSPLGPFTSFVRSLTFSPDGKEFAFWGSINRNYYLHAGGKSTGPFTTCGPILYPRGGGPLLYTANKGIAENIVIGERIYGPYNFVMNTVLSDDGARFACFAFIYDKPGVRYVCDEKGITGPFEDNDPIPFLLLSPDGKTLAFAAKTSGKIFVHVGAAKAGPYDFVQGTSPDTPWFSAGLSSTWSPRFSLDGRFFFYRARAGKRWQTLVLVEGRPFVGSVSPDGKSVAYYQEGRGIAKRAE